MKADRCRPLPARSQSRHRCRLHTARSRELGETGKLCIPKDRKERCASAVGERVGFRLTIMNYEALDRHCLHRMRGDADGDVADASRGAKQDHTLLCGAKLRGNPRGGDGGVREELATGMTAAPAHEWFR
jgi:hypothetical protein